MELEARSASGDAKREGLAQAQDYKVALMNMRTQLKQARASDKANERAREALLLRGARLRELGVLAPEGREVLLQRLELLEEDGGGVVGRRRFRHRAGRRLSVRAELPKKSKT